MTKFTKIENGNRCAYCGAPSSALDHFIPSATYKILHNLVATKNAEYLVPACRTCNSALNCTPFKTVSDKIDFMNQRYYKKFGRIATNKNWSPAQRAELEERASWTIDKNPGHTILRTIELKFPEPETEEFYNLLGHILSGVGTMFMKREIIRVMFDLKTITVDTSPE